MNCLSNESIFQSLASRTGATSSMFIDRTIFFEIHMSNMYKQTKSKTFSFLRVLGESDWFEYLKRRRSFPKKFVFCLSTVDWEKSKCTYEFHITANAHSLHVQPELFSCDTCEKFFSLSLRRSMFFRVDLSTFRSADVSRRKKKTFLIFNELSQTKPWRF